MTTLHVPISQLKIRSNYRQSYDPQFVASLVASMKKSGFWESDPIKTYRDGESFVVIDGNTRYTAASQVQADQPAIPFMVYITVDETIPSDSQFILRQLAGNETRRNPDLMSQAHGYKQAVDAGVTIEELSETVSHTIEYVKDRLALLDLNTTAQELVAKRQLSIKYALELTRLDTNFQNIALQYYQQMKAPDLEAFRDMVNTLYTKQSQCSLFDLALFNGQPIELIETTLDIQRPKTRKELEQELDAERLARKADREFARQQYHKLLKQYQILQSQLKVS